MVVVLVLGRLLAGVGRRQSLRRPSAPGLDDAGGACIEVLVRSYHARDLWSRVVSDGPSEHSSAHRTPGKAAPRRKATWRPPPSHYQLLPPVFVYGVVTSGEAGQTARVTLPDLVDMPHHDSAEGLVNECL